MSNALSKKDLPIMLDSYLSEFGAIEEFMQVERFQEAADLAVKLANRMLEDAPRLHQTHNMQLRAVATTLKANFAHLCRQAADAIQLKNLDVYPAFANRAQRTLKELRSMLADLVQKAAV